MKIDKLQETVLDNVNTLIRGRRFSTGHDNDTLKFALFTMVIMCVMWPSSEVKF